MEEITTQAPSLAQGSSHRWPLMLSSPLAKGEGVVHRRQGEEEAVVIADGKKYGGGRSTKGEPKTLEEI